MIASVRGRLLSADVDGLVVEVGGVGLRVHATTAARSSAAASPEDVRLPTHLVVREDALALYGFASEDERELFVALLGVTGVGPKAALAILSAYAPDRLRTALAAEDVALFASVTGIGKKIAGRIVLDLRGRLGPARASSGPVPVPSDDVGAAREALVGLGYSAAEAEAALATTSGGVEERVRQALGVLGAAA